MAKTIVSYDKVTYNNKSRKGKHIAFKIYDDTLGKTYSRQVKDYGDEHFNSTYDYYQSKLDGNPKAKSLKGALFGTKEKLSKKTRKVREVGSADYKKHLGKISKREHIEKTMKRGKYSSVMKYSGLADETRLNNHYLNLIRNSWDDREVRRIMIQEENMRKLSHRLYHEIEMTTSSGYVLFRAKIVGVTGRTAIRHANIIRDRINNEEYNVGKGVISDGFEYDIDAVKRGNRVDNIKVTSHIRKER